MSTQSQAYSRDAKLAAQMNTPPGVNDSDSNPEFVNVGVAINNMRGDNSSVKAMQTGPFVQAPAGDQRIQFQ